MDASGAPFIYYNISRGFSLKPEKSGRVWPWTSAEALGIAFSQVSGGPKRGDFLQNVLYLKVPFSGHEVERHFRMPGTNTFDRWEMRIHKRLIDLHSPSDAWG